MLKRLWQQITDLGRWLRGQACRNPLQSLLVLAGLSFFGWIVRETYKADNLGFNDKNLWDWFDLLIIPAVLAAGAWWLNKSEKAREMRIAKQRAATEREIAIDEQRQAILEAYFDRMTNLLLEKGLRTREDAETRVVARTRTLSVLRGLDPRRKGQVLLFLYESGLISKDRIVDLSGADFSEVQLQWVDLTGADLSGVLMRKVDLRGADLEEVSLSEADLSEAQLFRARLGNADLSGAILEEAELSFAYLVGPNTNLYHAQLRKAKLRKTKLCEATLSGADLRWAILRGADLREATLFNADLSNADLRGLNKADLIELRESGVIGPYDTKSLLKPAEVTSEQLETVSSLKNTIMPDGSVHE